MCKVKILTSVLPQYPSISEGYEPSQDLQVICLFVGCLLDCRDSES